MPAIVSAVGARRCFVIINSKSARVRWQLDSECEAGDAYTDEGAGAMLVVVEGPAFEQITLSATIEKLGCAASEAAMMQKDAVHNGEYSDTGYLGVEEDMLHFKDEVILPLPLGLSCRILRCLDYMFGCTLVTGTMFLFLCAR